MNIGEKLRRVLAAVILVCFFLPIAQCSSNELASGMLGQEAAAPKVLVPADDLKFESLDEIPLVAMYAWPLMFIAIRRVTTSRKARVVTEITEAVLASGFLYSVVATIGVWGRVRYGGVILVLALAAYLLSIAMSLWRIARQPSSKPLGPAAPDAS